MLAIIAEALMVATRQNPFNTPREYRNREGAYEANRTRAFRLLSAPRH